MHNFFFKTIAPDSCFPLLTNVVPVSNCELPNILPGRWRHISATSSNDPGQRNGAQTAVYRSHGYQQHFFIFYVFKKPTFFNFTSSPLLQKITVEKRFFNTLAKSSLWRRVLVDLSQIRVSFGSNQSLIKDMQCNALYSIQGDIYMYMLPMYTI